MKVKELRIILTVNNLNELMGFYTNTLKLPVSKEWHEATGNGIILEAGKASLELIDSDHAATIDGIEVGKRTAGPIRLAINVGENNLESAVEECLQGGAVKLAGITNAPWSKVIRLEDPSGMQFTLFEKSTLF